MDYTGKEFAIGARVVSIDDPSLKFTVKSARWGTDSLGGGWLFRALEDGVEYWACFFKEV